MLFLLGYSVIKPEVAAYLYKDIDMIELRNTSFASYAFFSVLLMTGPALKALIAGMMIGIFQRMNLESPFTMDIALAHLSILKTGKAKAVRFSTLEAICKALEYQPGDLLEFRP